MADDGVQALLIELGTEELPPTALRQLRDALAAGIEQGFAQREVAHGDVRRFASPRRLGLRIDAVPCRQPDRIVERRGPAVAAAFDDDGNPTKAAEGFARSCGVAVSELETLPDDKGPRLGYRATQPGQTIGELLPEVLDQALQRLPIPKRMRWGRSRAEFVRPVHWLVVLHGDAVLPMRQLDAEAGRETRGHRFMAPGRIALSHADEYEGRLREEGRVIADMDARRQEVERQVHALAAELGGEVVADDALLDEVSALVEWPVALAGRFDERFLEVPAEALISSMQGHQKCFPVRDRDGALLPVFITVSNIESRAPERVVEGNERVIRPRLADAAFFWEQDRRRPLAQRLDGLKRVLFQKQLGSVYEKSERVAGLCGYLAEGLGGIPAAEARRSGWLSKCDLATEMVGEFPELQGIMGHYYAVHDGEAAAVADALEAQYRPRFGGDETAAGRCGQILAIADRADTLVGIFAALGAPSGAKDPFALRRAALGLVRTIIERGLDVDLRDLLEQAATAMPATLDARAQVEPVLSFCFERLRAYYQDQGVAPEVFEAVAALRPVRPLDFDARVRACQRFLDLPEAESLTAANKRIRNILRRADSADLGEGYREGELAEAAEQALARELGEVAARVEDLIAERAYAQALESLAGLRESIDRFFDEIMVMAQEQRTRANRLGLLAEIDRLFSAIADISQLPGR
ncbi:glycine--tRNA ligase subunit beta [Ectothiorhodospiraceae bacterium WFHF3C12]|nr:glycine--tRNA ligase subunit beta [Ectothiorhodospiraceae bacterium WFHF3C12]